MRQLLENLSWQDRARQSIAQGALTNSKRPQCFIEGVYPTHIQRGYKCYLIDVDGNKYVDYVCGLGTNWFGYGNRQISSALERAISTGAVYSLASPDEVRFAEAIKCKFPFIEKIKILKEGSAGCSAAIKIARAYTGREYVLSEGYHGWHDDFVQLTPPAHGVIADNKTLFYRDDVEHSFLEQCAAVIVEPVVTDHGEKRRIWLQRLKEKCDKAGCLLIFDETITAYRFADYSVAKHWNIYPDIWIGGKALGGGLPISVVGGSAKVMDCDYFVSSTWAGDIVAIKAAYKSLELLTNAYHPNNVWPNGEEFLSRFNTLHPQLKIVGYPTRGSFLINNFYTLFIQEMCLAGVLFGPSWFYNLDLMIEMDNVIGLGKEVVKRISQGKIGLKGKPPQSAFSSLARRNL